MGTLFRSLVGSSASSVTVQIVPGVGHSFNGHLDNLASWTGIDAWLSETLDSH